MSLSNVTSPKFAVLVITTSVLLGLFARQTTHHISISQTYTQGNPSSLYFGLLTKFFQKSDFQEVAME